MEQRGTSGMMMTWNEWAGENWAVCIHPGAAAGTGCMHDFRDKTFDQNVVKLTEHTVSKNSHSYHMWENCWNLKGKDTSKQKSIFDDNDDLVGQRVACAKGVPLSTLPINIFTFLSDGIEQFTYHNMGSRISKFRHQPAPSPPKVLKGFPFPNF